MSQDRSNGGSSEQLDSTSKIESTWIRLRKAVMTKSALAVVAFLTACLILAAASEDRRIGDSGEYVAMSWQLSHLFPPALTTEDLAMLENHYRAVSDQMSGFEHATPMLPELESGGRYDQLHFWIYPMFVAPITYIFRQFGLPDTDAFTAFNIALMCGTFGIALRKLGAGAAALLFASPLIWWIDKPHGEILVFCLLTIALLFLHDHPQIGFVCVSILAAHNLGFAAVLLVYGAAIAVEHGRRLIDRRWKVSLLALGLLVALMHPAYYLWRLGVIDPQRVVGAAHSRVPTPSRLLTPVLDPYIGIVIWWPGLVGVCVVGGFVRAWRRPLTARSWRQWVTAWAPFTLGATVLLAAAQNNQPDSGGTFSMSRYAIWIAPFAVFALGNHVFLEKLSRALVLGAASGSAALSLHVAHPNKPDNYFTVRPTFVADAINEHAPWAWSSPPQVFLVRQSRSFGASAPVANDACTKLLAINGAWPESCPPPPDVPADCQSAPYCYANRSGDDYTFVTFDERA